MATLLNRLVSNPLGMFGLLAFAAAFEAWGDSFFQTSFYRASGFGRVLAFLAGTAVLACYGSVVNLPRWDFGKLLGVYVTLFFVVAQIVAWARFGQTPTTSIYAGGALIVIGGLVIAFWRA
ncbi:MAG TPA: hypothetical protein VK720_16530 [Terracidiphilus sp.]|nr:hypothetical protein [Terracidiphilus sp.]